MEKDEKKQNAVVQTYSADMAEVIEGGEEGLVKKIIHGEEEHEKEKMNLSPESKKNKLFMLFSFLLLFSAIGICFFFFLNKKTSTVEIAAQFAPLIFNDQTTFLEIPL